MPLRHFSLRPFAPIPSQLEVFLSFDAQSFSIAYYLAPPNPNLCWPATCPSRQDNLWQNTCFELFCKSPTGPDYVEFNFAPGGAWNAYHFTDYRQQMQQLNHPLAVVIQHLPGTWLRATVNWQITGPIAISAITTYYQDQGQGKTNYWALLHPNVRPDFHHPQGFITIQ